MKTAIDYKLGWPLFLQGEACDGALEVMHGTVSVVTKSSMGRGVCLRYKSEGAVLALSETLNRIPHHSTAIAVTDVKVKPISRRELLRRISKPETCVPLLSLLGAELTQLYETLRRIPPTQKWMRSKTKGQKKTLVEPGQSKGIAWPASSALTTQRTS